MIEDMEEEVLTVSDEMDDDEFMSNVFDDLRHDFENAKDAKVIIDELINEWNDLYYSVKRTPDGEISNKINKKENKSTIAMKEVAKQIEWQKPSITEPFTTSKNPIELTDRKSSARARVLEKWANYQFTAEFDRKAFIDQTTDVVLREGTVWVQTSWETKIENERIVIPAMSMEEMLRNPQEPDNISNNEDGTFRVEYNNRRMTENDPDSVVCRNEHCFPDPSARTEKEMRFFAKIELMTPSDLRGIEWIDQEKVEDLISRVSSEEKEDTRLGVQRDIDAKSYGKTSKYEPNDVTRKHIRMVVYYGYYDLNDDGIAEPIMALWSERHEIYLGIEENNSPTKAIPFDRSVYSARPFSLWGNPPAFFLGENQDAKNGIVRGVMDNMSLANNGQKFMQRGAVDYVNFKRMNNGERYIFVNKKDAIQDGSFNQLPSSVFNVLEMFTKESSELSGVSSGGPALTQDDLTKKSGLTMSQQRMAALVGNIGNLVSKCVSKWVCMGEVFLTDEQILELFEEEEEVDMNVFTVAKKSKVAVNVGTEVANNMKLQQLNMLMQQSATLEGELPPGGLKAIVAEMHDLFNMHEEATRIRLYVKEPSEQEKQMVQMEIQKAGLEMQKLQTEINVMEKDVEARYMNAQARMMEANANYGYKGAQTEEKKAKAQAHRVDTAMKPVITENEIAKTNTDAMNKTN